MKKKTQMVSTTLDFTSRIANVEYTQSVDFFVVVPKPLQLFASFVSVCMCVCVVLLCCFQHGFHSVFPHIFHTIPRLKWAKKCSVECDHKGQWKKFRTLTLSAHALAFVVRMLSIMRQKYSVGETGSLDRQLNKY